MPDIENTVDGVKITMSEDEYFEIAEIAASKIVKVMKETYLDQGDEVDAAFNRLALIMITDIFPAPPCDSTLAIEALKRKMAEMVMLEYGLTRLEEPKERN